MARKPCAVTTINPDRYRFTRANPIENEKLAVNRIVAELLRPQTVLEAFAGDGTSTRIFARHARQVVAIEKDGRYLRSFLESKAGRKAAVARCNNLALLPFLAPGSFDLVDLDPYGNCFPQLEHAARLRSPTGILLISSGQIQRVVRGLALSQLPDSRLYFGKRAVLWAESVWIPYLLDFFGRSTALHLVHFFTSPVLTRVILGPRTAQRALSLLRDRKKYLGWFEKAALNQLN